MRKVKLIVHETYQGKRKSEDVFAAAPLEVEVKFSLHASSTSLLNKTRILFIIPLAAFSGR